MTPVKPFLRWAGSKRQLIPVLSKYWNQQYKRYVEPFAGSACLFFAIQPREALLGDLNEELVFTYQQVKLNADQVKIALRKTRKSKYEYYKLRALDPATLSPADRAARFIYLNRFCFNGLYRTNRQGKFNVPYGGEGSGSLPSNEMLDLYSTLLQKATILASDFENTLKCCKQGDFIYLDPPYSVKAKRTFNEYDAATFSESDLLRLRKKLVELSQNNIHFVASYADCEEAKLLFDGFRSEILTVRRNISGFASNRREAKEVLFTNIPVPAT